MTSVLKWCSCQHHYFPARWKMWVWKRNHRPVCPAGWGPRWVASPKSPLGMSPVPKAPTKSVMMHFLQAVSLHSSKILWLKKKSTVTFNMWPENRWILWPSKEISRPLINCIFVSYIRNALPKIVPTEQEDEDNSNSPSQIYSTAHNKNRNINFANFGHQTTFRSWQETETCTIRLTLWRAALASASFGLRFSNSWNKYYSDPSKGSISVSEILQPLMEAYHPEPYKDSL